MISTYNIQTSMGSITSYSDALDFLSENEILEFDNIGYTGKTLDNEKTNIQEYLNSIGKGEFVVKKTKHDNGNFIEKFTIIRVTE